MTKEELIKQLRDLLERHSPQTHEIAERLLLDFINDQAITDLWDGLQDDWWYS